MNLNTTDESLIGALAIVDILVKNGYQALFAGGFVRDNVLDCREKGDIDIATNAKPETIASLFRNTIGVGEQFGVMIVVQKGIPFEVATFRSDIGIHDGRHPQRIVFTDARTDALRRDFTINGMFYDPLTDKIIDYVNGFDDCKNGIIRAIGDAQLRFSEDYLRILRAIRFASRFEFSIEPTTWDAVCSNAHHINEISPERIFTELNKMLCGPHADRAITLLHQSGLLQQILPEVSATVGIEQPPEFHPEGDVFAHIVKALGLLGDNPTPALAWSVLLHDIGKPKTMSFSDRVRFNNHDQVGADLAINVLRRLRASNELIDAVDSVVRNHMNFMNVTRMRLSTLKKFLSRSTINEDTELHRIDCSASHGDLSNYYFVKEKKLEFPVEQIRPAPFVTGKDLLALGLKPGPLFGRIINEMYDLQLEDRFTSKEEAIEAVRVKYIEKGK